MNSEFQSRSLKEIKFSISNKTFKIDVPEDIYDHIYQYIKIFERHVNHSYANKIITFNSSNTEMLNSVISTIIDIANINNKFDHDMLAIKKRVSYIKSILYKK